jgi:SpoVK/Ycf46/Vps4 family AAA+-type ATPase
VAEIEPEPVWPERIGALLLGIVAERKRETELLAAGLAPTRSLLFVGRPGVGKTLAARWLAFKLNRPLLILDLAAVMSSFLGKTGNNIRAVLDYARRAPSVLLLDEFDAIAKRRDDATEIGELKRLVTVLLQAVDDWPPEGLLIAASNHPELLDPAVWRRFDQDLIFPIPSFREAKEAITRLLPEAISEDTLDLLAATLAGSSFAEIAKVVYAARRRAVLEAMPPEACILDTISRLCCDTDAPRRLEIAKSLNAAGRGQREIRNLTGLARDTLRKHRIVGRKH